MPIDDIDSYSGLALLDAGDDVLLDITPARVYTLVRGRNAWHGTWAQHYLGPSSMHATEQGARDAAESRRQRGSVFYVTEAPALRFKGFSLDVIAVDFHPLNSFATFGIKSRWPSSRLGPGMSLTSAIASLEPTSGHWRDYGRSGDSVRIGQVFPNVRLRPGGRRPFVAYRSQAQGTGFYLRWLSTNADRSYSGTSAVTASWSRVLTRTPSYASEVRQNRKLERDSCWGKYEWPEPTVAKSRARLRDLAAAL